MRARSIVVITLAAGALLAGGCSGGDDEEPVGANAQMEAPQNGAEQNGSEASGDELSMEEYQEELNSVGAEFQEIGQAAQSLGDVSDPEEAVQAIEGIVSDFDAVVDDFDALNPPQDIADTHDALVESLRTYTGELARAADTLEEGDPTSAQTIVLDAVQAFIEDAQELSSEYREAGYSF